MKTFRDHYKTVVIPQLQKALGITNVFAVPKIVKVTLNVGAGKAVKDEKFLVTVQETLSRITGQKPVVTRARKSIAAFKIRAGMPIGAKVTLRGKRMDDFLTKLVHVSLPRIRDFRGLSPNSVDAQGNVTIGFREHLVFPEIGSDEVEKLHGLEVVITTTAKNPAECLALLRAARFPFQSEAESKRA